MLVEVDLDVRMRKREKPVDNVNSSREVFIVNFESVIIQSENETSLLMNNVKHYLPWIFRLTLAKLLKAMDHSSGISCASPYCIFFNQSPIKTNLLDGVRHVNEKVLSTKNTEGPLFICFHSGL